MHQEYILCKFNSSTLLNTPVPDKTNTRLIIDSTDIKKQSQFKKWIKNIN